MTARCSEYQRYNFLKAIHNWQVNCWPCDYVVQNIKDTIFWKQFTTAYNVWYMLRQLFRISKIQFFESNSQHTYETFHILNSCSEYQRYNFLKAIHNAEPNNWNSTRVVQNIKDTIFWKQFTTCFLQWFSPPWLFRISKIQFFESNSQHMSKIKASSARCSEYQRYNFLKAIHNV